MKSDSGLAWPWALVATFTAYTLVGLAALQLQIPPGYATPLFPSTGVALVSLLVIGWRMLPAIWLGAFVVDLSFALTPGPLLPSAVVLPAVAGFGSMVQAAVGAALLQRLQGRSLKLTEPGEVASLFLFAGALACTIAPTAAVATLAVMQQTPHALLPRVWLTWWIGDTLGVLIGTPIALALVGRPRAIWVGRRRSVALPMIVVTSLAVIGITHARSWDEDRAALAFERDAHAASIALVERLQDPLRALEATRGLILGADGLTAQGFERASAAWLASSPGLQSIGWNPRVERSQLAAFEAEVRRDGPADFTVFRIGAHGERLPPEGHELMPTRFIEPPPLARRFLGSDALAIDTELQAIELARTSDRPAVSAGFALKETPEGQTGVSIYRAVYRTTDRTTDRDGDVPEAERSAQTRGVVFVTLRMEDFLRSATAGLPTYLNICLFDASPAGLRRHLAGPAHCEDSGSNPAERLSEMSFAGRTWHLRTSARDVVRPELEKSGAWLFAVISLLATATFGVLLLTMTGRALRIESAVGDRTAALQREIGERSRSEAALRESEQRLRNILDHVPIGVVYTDMQGHIKQSNPKFRQLVGYDAEELAQRTAFDLMHPEDRNAARDRVTHLSQGDMAFYQSQARWVRRDGKLLWLRAVVSLLRNEAGSAHRVVAVLEDMGENLKLRDAEDAREIAEAANLAKTDFLSRMSQELRTPLTAMLGFAELIEHDRLNPASAAQRSWITQIQGKASRLLGMVDDTLDLSRVESGTIVLRAETVDLPSLLQEALARVAPEAQRRGIIVTHELAAHATRLRGDAGRVAQILAKLLDNAVDHNQDHGRVHVEGRAQGAMVEIIVTDTGPGLSDERMRRLFHPSSLGTEDFGNEPTGLGLVIGRRLAELMHGRLEVRSLLGQGTSFTLSLPRALPAGREDSDDGAMQGGPDGAVYRERIVHYIEDNETNALVMEGILAQRPQVQLRVSVNGLDGLAAIRKRPPSMILLDMHLPDIDGLQILRMLKDDPATAAIPVVVVSADAVVTRIQQALQAGAEYYLTKPVNVAELLRLVDSVLEERDTLFG